MPRLAETGAAGLDTIPRMGNTTPMTPDILLIWFNVHGGAFHKLLALHDRLRRAGCDCRLGLNASPPRGLKAGADIPEALLPQLEADDVRLLPRPELLAWADSLRPRLIVADAHHDPDIPGLLERAAARGAITAQMATLLGDFTTHGAAHLLMQHPLTLFFEREFNRTKESARLAQAATIHFTGNVFFEPATNPLFGGFADREAFCAKYGLDPARPTLLWLPSSPDASHPVYAEVCRAVTDAGMNLAIKLHPWEYAIKKHGRQPGDAWGPQRPSDEAHGLSAVDEPDGSWAMRFCDAAILRTSAMSLELPFWERPALQLPAEQKPKLFEAQAHMSRPCTVSLGGVDALERMLRQGDLPCHRPEDYQRARNAVRLPGPGDGFDRTVAALKHILDGCPDAPPPAKGADDEVMAHMTSAPALLRPGGDPGALSRASAPFVDDMLLRTLPPLRRVAFDLGGLKRWLGRKAGDAAPGPRQRA